MTHLCAVAELKAEAARVETDTELECQTRAREAEIEFRREQNQLETSRARELGRIEVRERVGYSVEQLLRWVDKGGGSTIVE